MQQPTLFLAEWGVMMDNKRGSERGGRQRERRKVTREERVEVQQERDGVT